MNMVSLSISALNEVAREINCKKAQIDLGYCHSAKFVTIWWVAIYLSIQTSQPIRSARIDAYVTEWRVE